MWGNIAPLVLYTDLQRCFLKLALPHLKAVLCIFNTASDRKGETPKALKRYSKSLFLAEWGMFVTYTSAVKMDRKMRSTKELAQP